MRVNLWLGSAWWLQLCINLGLSHRPPLRGAHSNQGSRFYLRKWCQKGARCEKLEKIVIDGDPKKFFQVETQLPPLEKEELIMFLKRNIDVFTWNAYETPGVDPDFICHHLNVNPVVLPKKQPPRCLSKEHSDVIKEEVNKFKQAGAIKEVFYPKWLANIVAMKKKNGKWRVCVDFIDLNPKDPFPMPQID